MPSSPTEQLKEWYVNFIKFFREECSKLSEEEQKQLLINHDCNPPCQIEVFWLSNPNWQLIVTTHFEDRSDLEIIINGPYESSIFQEEVEKIINHPRWNKPLYRNSKDLNSNLSSYYNETIAQWLHNFIKTAKNATFMNHNKIMGFSRWVNLESGSIEHFFGDKRLFDYKKLIKKIVDDVKNQLKSSKKLQLPSQKQTEQPNYHKGFGTYFLPSIVIGKLPKPTVSDRLYGAKRRRISAFDKKSFVKTFGETSVIITNDGYIGTCTDDKDLAIMILNTIMATFEIEGLEAIAVREHELSEIDYDPQKLNITGFSYSYNIIRNEPFHDFPKEATMGHQTREIEEDTIRKIIEKASKIFEDPEMAKAIVDFGDMLAHLKDSEFPQAFLKGWTIIEQHISQKWKDEIHPKQAGGKKNSKRLPSVDDMLKDLRSIISSQHYDTFMIMKGIRNKHLHKRKLVTKAQAEDCMGVTKEIILKKYYSHLPR